MIKEGFMGFMPEGWPIPGVDKFNKDFFTSGKIVVQECTNCGNIQHPPEQICFKCREMDQFRSKETNGMGTGDSYIVVPHPASPAMASVVPYTIALVSLDEHPQVHILG